MAGVINAELSPLFGEVEFRWDFTKVDAMQDTEDARTKRLVWLVDGRVIKPEVAASELGYDPEDVPEPLPTPDFGSPSDNNNNVGRATSPPPTSDDRKTEAALYKWRRKALNNVKSGGAPHCTFRSEYVPEFLNDKIDESLKAASTRDDVMAIFDGAIGMGIEVENMQDQQWVQILTEAIKAMGSNAITIKADNMEVIQRVPKPEVFIENKIEVPEQRAPDVKVNVSAPDISVEPTPIEIVNEVDIKLPGRITGKKKVNRNAAGRIESVDEVTELGG